MEKLTTLVLFCLLAIACGGGSGGLDDHDPDSPVMETDDPDSPVMETEESPKDEVVELLLGAFDDLSGSKQAIQNEVKEAVRSWQGGENCFVGDYIDSSLWPRISVGLGFRGADIDHSDSSDVENLLENAIDLELDGVETTKEIWERVACKLEPDNCVCWSQIYGADVAPDRGEEYDDSMGVPIPPSPELTAECHTPRELFNFLKESSSNCLYNPDSGVRRWEDAPTIRLAEDATDREREMVRLIVDRINLAMPWELKIGKDAPAKQLGSPDGEIWVDFAPQAEWAYKDDRSLAGVAVPHFSDTNSHEIARAHVWVIPSDIMGYEGFEYPLAIGLAGRNTSYVVAHELLHALGLHCHVQSKWRKQSVMEAGLDEAGIVFRTNVLYHLERNGPAVRHKYYYCNIDGDPYCYYSRQNIPGDIDLDALKALYLHDTGERPNRNDLPGELCEWRTD